MTGYFISDRLWQILNYLFIWLSEIIQQSLKFTEGVADLEVPPSFIFLTTWFRQMLFSTLMEYKYNKNGMDNYYILGIIVGAEGNK